jgi:hypothetical protein
MLADVVALVSVMLLRPVLLLLDAIPSDEAS